MNRRAFGGHLVTGGVATLVLADTFLLEGCNPLSWEDQAIAIVKLLGPAVQGILAIISAFAGIPPADITAIQTIVGLAVTAISNIGSWITQYMTNASSGLLSDIQNALSVVQSNIQSILATIHVTNTALVNKVSAVVTLVVDWVQSIASLIPALKVGLAEFVKRVAATPAAKASTFKSAFNKELNTKTGIPTVDAAMHAWLLS